MAMTATSAATLCGIVATGTLVDVAAERTVVVAGDAAVSPVEGSRRLTAARATCACTREAKEAIVGDVVQMKENQKGGRWVAKRKTTSSTKGTEGGEEEKSEVKRTL